MEVMKKQGFGLHMQKLLFHSRVSLVSFLKDQISHKYKGKNCCNFPQSLLRKEPGRAVQWPHLPGTICWFCTVVLLVLQASTLSMHCTMNTPSLFRVVIIPTSVHLMFSRKE